MKRISHLYDNLSNKEFIKQCILDAAYGKKRRREVKEVLDNIDYYVDIIYDMIINHNLILGPTHQKKIREYIKTREITISPFFPNQVLDYMLVNSLKPLFKKMFYLYAVGNVNGKGIKYGNDYLISHIKKYNHHIKLDVHHFYQSINTEILMKKLERRIKDREFLDFIRTIICRFKYLPIGTYYSQWLSNFYLMELDYYIKQELHIPLYIRYVDDMQLCSNDKEQLQNCQVLINNYLKENLDLELKFYGTTKRISDSPISFLGFKIYRNKVLLRKSIFYRIIRTTKSISQHLSIHLARRLISLTGWLKQIGKIGYLFYKRNIYPIIKLGYLRRIISNEAISS